MVTRTKKIFVGGLSAQSTLEDVKNYFEQFGKVRKTRGNFRNWPRRISVVWPALKVCLSNQTQTPLCLVSGTLSQNYAWTSIIRVWRLFVHSRLARPIAKISTTRRNYGIFLHIGQKVHTRRVLCSAPEMVHVAGGKQSKE